MFVRRCFLGSWSTLGNIRKHWKTLGNIRKTWETLENIRMTARARLFPGSHVNGSSCEVSSLRLQAATVDKHFPEWSLEPSRSGPGQAGLRQDLFPIWQRVSLRKLTILWFFAQGFPGFKIKTEIRRAAFCSPQRRN